MDGTGFGYAPKSGAKVRKKSDICKFYGRIFSRKWKVEGVRCKKIKIICIIKKFVVPLRHECETDDVRRIYIRLFESGR
jgi:hypothetical protein